MTNKLSLFRQKISAALLIGAAAAAIALALAAAGWLDELEWKSFDLRVRLARSVTPPPPEIAVILIDEASLRMMNTRVGRWPWPRSLHADVVDFLAAAGARRIVFDILFTENERDAGEASGKLSDNDARLASAVASAGNVVSAAQLLRDDPDDYNHGLLNRSLPVEFVRRFSLPDAAAAGNPATAANNAYLPFAELTASSSAIGVVEFAPDRDGIYRRTRLIRTYGEKAFPTLSLAALSDQWQPEAGQDNSLHLLSRGSAAEHIDLPLQSDGEYLIKPYKDFRAYSMSGVLVSIHQLRQGEIENLPVHPEEFRDKIVLIGASAVGVEDLKPTPFGTLQPGVFLHASIIGNILHHDFLHTPPAWLMRVTTILLPLLIALAVLLPARTVWRIIAPITLALTFLAAGQGAFEAQWVVEMVAPWTGMALAWLGSLARLSATEGREKRRIRKMFGQYVSPAVLESIADNAAQGLLQAEVGRREHLTILFSDIRGFTTLSESLKPEELVKLLNDYLSPMTRIVLEERGTLDKYIGDAMMVIFNAPLDVPNHPEHACRSAFRMLERLAELNQKFTASGLPMIDIGIGIHTGEAIVGNMGADIRFDYTAIGDNVNLASRLEGLNKYYGTRILVSSVTMVRAGEGFVFREVDLVRVKGKNEPVAVYELMTTGQEFAPRFAEGLALYRNCRFSEAMMVFADLLESGDDRLSALYLDRCREFMVIPPPEGWDGVYIARDK